MAGDAASAAGGATAFAVACPATLVALGEGSASPLGLVAFFLSIPVSNGPARAVALARGVPIDPLAVVRSVLAGSGFADPRGVPLPPRSLAWPLDVAADAAAVVSRGFGRLGGFGALALGAIQLARAGLRGDGVFWALSFLAERAHAGF